MADVKITELTALTSPQDVDVLPIVDTSASTTKKISFSDLGSNLLQNAGDGTTSSPAFSFQSDTNSGIYLASADKVAVTTNGSGRLFVDGSGNVGINKESPTSKLDVSGDAAVSGALTAGSAAITGALTQNGNNVVTTASTNFVTSAMVVDGAILDADINASAEIAVSKLGNGTARQLLQTDAAGTGVEFTSNVDVPGTLDVTGAATFDNNLTIAGNLTVNGTTTTIDSTTLAVEDKNIELGVVSSPTDATADGGGITLIGATDKTLTWIDSTDSWTFNQSLEVQVTAANTTIQLWRANMASNNTYCSFISPASDSALEPFTWKTDNAFAWQVDNTTAMNVNTDGTVSIGTLSVGTLTGQTQFSHAADASINGVTIGRGSGNVSTNTALGANALAANQSTGQYNTAVGADALAANTTADYNVAVGRSALEANTTGYKNIAIGYRALYSQTNSFGNVAVGHKAMQNTTTSTNVAVGYEALSTNTSGDANVALGYNVMYENTTGDDNVALGMAAMYKSTSAMQNVAIGKYALGSYDGDPNSNGNFQGDHNIAIGDQVMKVATTANRNVVIGNQAGIAMTTATWNVGIGDGALEATTSGTANVAIGRQAARDITTGQGNTAVGQLALSTSATGINNVAIGYRSGKNLTSGDDNIILGGSVWDASAAEYSNDPVFNVTTENDRLVLGHTSITNAYVQVAFTVTSDERDKINFAPVPYGLDFVNKLKPTAFQFKVNRETDTPNGDVRYGFKAQDILSLEGDNPVIIDVEDPDRLKYKGEHLVPVLVNAVQELTVMVNDLKAELAALKGA